MELGIIPASIHNLYMARGRGEIKKAFVVPAINLRVLTFDAARAIFRVIEKLNIGPVIFEIARSEMNYTDQRPVEYATSIFCAAIAEGYKGPIFLQGDHYQVSAKRYLANHDSEVESVRSLIRESIAAGFYNIDVDTSTLVDLNQATITAQQVLNTQLSAMFTTYIRSVQPDGVVISVGGEIGEVGGHNSTVEELRAYLDGFNDELNNQITGITGLSKVSIQTGTSHGGVVLPNGSMAQLNVDFDTMKKLGKLARNDYGLGGVVQHGASTLPEEAFGKFVEAEACEVHLATNFMNIFFDMAPKKLKDKMYAYIKKTFEAEKTSKMTDEQFYYKLRKNALGTFKSEIWELPESIRTELSNKWEEQFLKIFQLLEISDTRKIMNQYVKPVVIRPDYKKYLGEEPKAEDLGELFDLSD
ncbi:MAG: class II fructose-bisphosphate aldolase [Anaerolineaceae bacterium]|nr:class II fructose-bisphosphate aldolase [Anaerolineaceae bacterium]